MMDYRGNPAESPLVWCISCAALRPVTSCAEIMMTVFRVEETGIFPYGICEDHKTGVLEPVCSR